MTKGGSSGGGGGKSGGGGGGAKSGGGGGGGCKSSGAASAGNKGSGGKMDSPSAFRIQLAGAKNPGGDTHQSGFDSRAQSAAAHNQN